MTNTETIGQFYQRLNHSGYGVTELVVIDPGKGIIATGFFDSQDDFVKACQIYNGKYNIYAGRNPRPRWLSKVCENYLDTRYRQRARDSDIEYMTAVSLDIDPIRPKDTSSTNKQHRQAISFAMMLHSDIAGCVDDSGNGAYLWIPFRTPVPLHHSREMVKEKCRQWQKNIVKLYQPEKYGLRIDGCFDLSRIKKVIGTRSVKGKVHRVSRFIKTSEPNDRVRNEILALMLPTKEPVPNIKPSESIPQEFYELLKANSVIRELWMTPNPDRSMHDWMLGCELVKAGVKPEDIARILMINPFGKYCRDQRYGYIQTTISNLESSKWQ